MAETKETRRVPGSRRPQTVAREHAGQWIAWSPDGLRIVAAAETFEEAERAASAAGFSEVAIERVPDGRERITGSAS